MRKYFFTFILGICIYGSYAQNTPTPTAQQVKNTSEIVAGSNKFNILIQNKNYKEAVNEGIRLSQNYTANSQYKEAFAICRAMDSFIYKDAAETGKSNYDLSYLVSKERLRMYTRIKKWDQSKAIMAQLTDLASKINNSAINEDLLLTEAAFYHNFGMEDKSLAAYKELVNKRAAGKSSNEVGKCYKDMVTYAEQNNNAPLAVAMRKLYNSWQDSINNAKTSIELSSLQEKYTTTQETLNDKESTIKTNIFIIISLCVLCAGLAIAVFFMLGLLYKNIRKYKKLKSSLIIANENNEQKSKFISNISDQINPTLDIMEESINEVFSADTLSDSIKALKNLTKDINSYINIEESREEKYPLQEINVNTLCEKIMEKAKASFKPDVEAVLNVPKVVIRTNPEALEKVLLHLLINAGKFTDSGKITLEFKKRSAHSGQFMVTDTGCGIDKDQQEKIFKPFAQMHDIRKGSGLGLPTCAIITYKLNGTIHIDPEHKKGTRFIVELHS